MGGLLLSGIVPGHTFVHLEDGQEQVRGNRMQIRRSLPRCDWSRSALFVERDWRYVMGLYHEW